MRSALIGLLAVALVPLMTASAEAGRDRHHGHGHRHSHSRSNFSVSVGFGVSNYDRYSSARYNYHYGSAYYRPVYRETYCAPPVVYRPAPVYCPPPAVVVYPRTYYRPVYTPVYTPSYYRSEVRFYYGR